MMAASPTASALRLASTVRGAAVAAGRVTRVDGRTLISPRRGVASAPVASWGGGRDGGDVNGPLADQRAPPPPQRAPLPPPPPPSPDSPPLPASRGRALQRTSSPSLTFRIAGVTFEGRQAAVAGLTPGQALRLVQEPDNPADPAAVAVETLPGARLGYVPRDRTGEVFGGGGGCVCGDLGHVYGRVLSVGQAAPDEEEGGGGGGGTGGEGGGGHRQDPSAPWGAAVALHPGLPPLDPDALPPSLRAASDLAAWLPPTVWDALRGATARGAGFRCEVTGGRGAGCAVAVHEAWALDRPARVARLTGLQALAPECHIAKHALSLAGPAGAATALATLRAVNGWSVEEAAGVLGSAAEAAQAAEDEGGWRLDLGWLGRAAGLRYEALPPDVAAVCVAWGGEEEE